MIVVGGRGLKSAEAFDEVLDRWLRLPCDLPLDSQLHFMGGALLETTWIRILCTEPHVGRVDARVSFKTWRELSVVCSRLFCSHAYRL